MDKNTIKEITEKHGKKKEVFRKYRALSVFIGFSLFNLISSLMLAEPGHAFNLKPMSTAEWICDIISNLGILYSIMLASYDVMSFKPRKKYTYYKDIETGEFTKVEIEV